MESAEIPPFVVTTTTTIAHTMYSPPIVVHTSLPDRVPQEESSRKNETEYCLYDGTLPPNSDSAPALRRQANNSAAEEIQEGALVVPGEEEDEDGFVLIGNEFLTEALSDSYDIVGDNSNSNFIQ